jgi:hypothetical protein
LLTLPLEAGSIRENYLTMETVHELNLSRPREVFGFSEEHMARSEQSSRTGGRLLIIAVMFASVVGVNMWGLARDREVRQAAVAYENCVQNEYHMTPIQWYELNHQYPQCGN